MAVEPEDFGELRLKGILFGCDNWGTVLDEKAPYKNKKGLEMKQYLILVNKNLVKYYPELKKPGMLVKTSRGYAVWREYPTYWINDSNNSRTNAVVRVYCAFDGKETSETKRVSKYTNEVKQLMEENENLRINNMNLLEENRELMEEKKTLFKNIKEMSDMGRSGGTIVKETDKNN